MPAPPPGLANHLDTIRRLAATARKTPTHALDVGWLSYERVGDGGEVPSNCGNRIQWLAADEPISQATIAEAFEAMKRHGKRRAFAWLAPTAWDARVDADLKNAGAHPWPYVEYPVLARPVGEVTLARPTTLQVRVIEPAEVTRILTLIAPWYSDAGIQAVADLVNTGTAELHAAFEGPKPVAAGVLIMDGRWGYLGWAGTDPEFRGRGGQSALIRSRIHRARDLGATWCVSETVTIAATSLKNLGRLGFKETFRIRVYGWSAPA